MDLKILNSEVQEFIDHSIGTTIGKLALQKNPFPAVEWISILNQIEAKTKAQDKLPNWFKTKKIIYPSKVSVEQTSSEKTALYKSTIIFGNSLIDLTGGFGVDDYYFAKRVATVAHCEINPDLSDLVAHNYRQLGVENITCYAGDSLKTLASLNQKWDWIYIDPSRRNEAKGKVFMLKDCLPNVPTNLNFYFKNAEAILIKTAPLLDISAGVLELQNVKTIHILAVENDVKELLWELHKEYQGETEIKTVNLLKDKNETFDFIWNSQSQISNYSMPERYLYEPNSAIMKSGGFDEIGVFYALNKLHKHSHLYTSLNLISFPGRIFEIVRCISYNKIEMKAFLQDKKANVTIRNFPETVENIRKKWKIKDGGNLYCFFTIDQNNNKIVLICTKI